ncbi:hypothetical protein [Streptomyces sp. NPDC059787]|uniref:hypothetical protein n=1 Tax=Streptomyces sp. NPDC059787 TaxID=3346947 RepID=UPI00364CF168
MYMQGRGLRLTAMSVMVVLALTGFSSGRVQGNSSQDNSDEGGCSSSSQDHDGSTPGGSDPLGGSSTSSPSGDSYNSGTSNNSGGGSQPTPTVSASGSTAPPLKDGTAVLVRCASMEDPYATVEIRNPNGRDAVLNVKVSFADKHGYTFLDTGNQILVPAKDKTTYRVPAKMRYTDRIAQCEVDPVATAVW